MSFKSFLSAVPFELDQIDVFLLLLDLIAFKLHLLTRLTLKDHAQGDMLGQKQSL